MVRVNGLAAQINYDIHYDVLRTLFYSFEPEIALLRANDLFTLDDIAKRIELQHKIVEAMNKYETDLLGEPVTEFKMPLAGHGATHERG